MTPLLGIALALGLLAGLPAPAPGATIEGRIVHPTRPDASAGVEVFLLGITREGTPREERTRTDAEGRFSFAGLPDDGAYLLGATYRDVPFAGPSVVLKPGKKTEPVTFHIFDRTDDPAGVELRAVRWVVEREAGTYRVRQTVEVHNSTLRVVVLDPKAPPALRVPLATGHDRVESPLGRLPAGATVQNGKVELRGPIPPGDREYVFAYDVQSDGEALRTELRITAPAEQVDLLIRDFGVRVDVGALHPARPVRDGDSIYLRYVGFDLAAGTGIPVEIVPLAPAAATPRWLQVLLRMGLAGGLALLVGRALDRSARPKEDAEEEAADPERAALAAALRDLEFDYETGKLSAEDRERIRAELRRETAEALARRQAAPAEKRPACACGHEPDPGNRFCSACGTAL